LPFTTAGAVVATAFVALPLLVLSVEAGLRSLDPRLENAAATMGATPWFRFRRVMIPMLRPQIIAGLILAWARALGEFGATLMFAGNLGGKTQTLPLAAFQASQTDPGASLLIALLLVVLSLAVLIALRGRLLAPRTP
jgi:molybdate transport system permease protein